LTHNKGDIDNMDDMYLREQVLPAVTIQALTFAFITVLIWVMCIMRACQLRREVEEYLVQHPDIEAVGNRGDISANGSVSIASVSPPPNTATTAGAAAATAVTASVAVISSDEEASNVHNPVHATNLAPITATNAQVVSFTSL
jgi:hypothetical protein